MRICGVPFNDSGVAVTDAEMQATWARHVAAERLEQDATCDHGMRVDQRCISCDIDRELERGWMAGLALDKVSGL